MGGRTRRTTRSLWTLPSTRITLGAIGVVVGLGLGGWGAAPHSPAGLACIGPLIAAAGVALLLMTARNLKRSEELTANGAFAVVSRTVSSKVLRANEAVHFTFLLVNRSPSVVNDDTTLGTLVTMVRESLNANGQQPQCEFNPQHLQVIREAIERNGLDCGLPACCSLNDMVPRGRRRAFWTKLRQELGVPLPALGLSPKTSLALGIVSVVLVLAGMVLLAITFDDGKPGQNIPGVRILGRLLFIAACVPVAFVLGVVGRLVLPAIPEGHDRPSFLAADLASLEAPQLEPLNAMDWPEEIIWTELQRSLAHEFGVQPQQLAKSTRLCELGSVSSSFTAAGIAPVAWRP